MMMGSYPCCEGHLSIPMPEKTPKYLPEACPHCGAKVWHLMSKATPTSWIEEDFLKEHDVDHETKIVTRKTA